MSKSDLSLIEAAVQENLKTHFKQQRPRFVAAVSGGMDSMSLLYAFSQLDIPVLVSHINYQKRGEASEKDEQLVKQMASQWGFECRVSKVDPAKAEGKNFQQWARKVRYDRFYRQAESFQADGIALAHHGDDQVETILQKIFRGSGLGSWGGMKVWDRKLFRPLLGVSREQIKQFVHAHSIPYRTDASNRQSDFARNFLRNEWLGQLEEFFPGWKQNILRVKDHARDFTHALDWIQGRVCDEWGVRREDFHSMEPGLQKALILHLLKQEDPQLQVSRDSLQRLDEAPGLQTGQEIPLAESFSLHRDRSHYVLKEEVRAESPPVPLTYEELAGEGVRAHNLRISLEKYSRPDFSEALYLDSTKIAWPLKLRLWRPGDRFVPFGMEGHQQVSDHLANRKVSSAYKNRALVIESFEETICAVIFPPIKNSGQPGTIAEHTKCGADTEICLKITHKN